MAVEQAPSYSQLLKAGGGVFQRDMFVLSGRGVGVALGRVRVPAYTVAGGIDSRFWTLLIVVSSISNWIAMSF